MCVVKECLTKNKIKFLSSMYDYMVNIKLKYNFLILTPCKFIIATYFQSNYYTSFTISYVSNEYSTHQYSVVFWLIWVFSNNFCCGCLVPWFWYFKKFLKIVLMIGGCLGNRLTKASSALARLPVSSIVPCSFLGR